MNVPESSVAAAAIAATSDNTTLWPATVYGAYCRDHHSDIYQLSENIAMKNQTRAIDKSSPVSLREITREMARVIMMLDVHPHQRGLVAPNAVSIGQAHFAPEAWMRAIYADERPVGFVMLEDWTQLPCTPSPNDATSDPAPHLHEGKPYVYLWRFMIDARYQQLGFGAHALNAVIAHARTRPGVKKLLLSFVPAAQNPEAFYARFGFVRTGEMDGDEVVMALAL
jgi:diamine N-acetyltransferase